ILVRFIKLNVRGFDAPNAGKYSKAFILFGLSSHKASARTKTINNALLSAKALVAKSLTLDRPLQPLDIGQYVYPPLLDTLHWTSGSLRSRTTHGR
ncbi:Hypothetical protein FKW44_017019, partial [Caligus rogercresseyi]